MLPDRVSNPGPLTYESGALPIALRGPAHVVTDSSMNAGPRSAVGSAFNSKTRGPGFNGRPGHILSYLLPLIQEGQLSVTGVSYYCQG